MILRIRGEDKKSWHYLDDIDHLIYQVIIGKKDHTMDKSWDTLYKVAEIIILDSHDNKNSILYITYSKKNELKRVLITDLPISICNNEGIVIQRFGDNII